MLKKMATVFCSVGLFWIIAIPAVAQPVDNSRDSRTIMMFSQPVELPGIVLPAGTYVFKLADSDWNRNIVQVFNADETHLVTTVIAIATSRHTGANWPVEDPATHKTAMSFEERLTNSPQAIQTWFYPDREVGLEFVYPKVKAANVTFAKAKTKSPSVTASVAAGE